MKGVNSFAVLDIAILRQEADHPCAEAFDEVETEAVEAELFDDHARVFEHGFVDIRIAVAKVRKARVEFTLHHDLFVAAGVKAVPVARKFAAGGLELRPTFLPVERIDFFFIRA